MTGQHPDPRGAGSDGEDAARRVWRDLRLLVVEQHDRRRAVSDELGMGFNRVKTLVRIAAAGPMTLRQIAAYMVIDAPYATVIVDDLVRRGLVERTENPADRRSKLVHTTPAGVAAAARADAILTAPPDALLALPEDELAALSATVRALLA